LIDSLVLVTLLTVLRCGNCGFEAPTRR